MKLLTKELKRKIPKLYAQDGLGTNAIIYAKLFCPWNQWTWYILEWDGNDTLFAYVLGEYREYGFVSLKELASIKGPLNLKVERDLYFVPQRLQDLLNKK